MSRDVRLFPHPVYAANRKSIRVAAALWLVLGGLGAHRFYLGRTLSGALQAMLFVLGWATLIIVIGGVALAAWFLWWLADLAMLPGMVRAHNGDLAAAIAAPDPARASFGQHRLAR
ncbi:TM2 domain-containing protein [Sphingomonas japonica]|uniref:TM2 domain-containing membrane protein YozV n=1 Tax=Sphingomonas japonica TaxID=511662 RepID=A0ABX0U6J0_9SPHN|nr:TM2 domain-containing protein [Sphingomonas japonica]NIJ24393.1 TM2 domain-containing membrane protein YozV [Sphingomonas japonica]